MVYTEFKAYKYRIYPNTSQAELIGKTIGCARFVFNFFLSEQRRQEDLYAITEELYQNGTLPCNEFKSSYFNKRQAYNGNVILKSNYPFLKEVDKFALESSLDNLNNAYDRYYKKLGKKPKFKSKKNRTNSYTTKFTNGNIKVLDNHIQLPKIGLVKYKNPRTLCGDIVKATISKTSTNKYYVSVVCKRYTSPVVRPGNYSIGIDLGIKHYAIFSNGEIIGNPKFYTKLQNKLIRAQQKLNLKTIGSNNFKKQKLKIAKIYEKINNCLRDFMHKLSTKIVSKNQVISVETLSIKSMLQDSDYSKSISEVAWGMFINMLEYKSHIMGRTFIKVGNKYPSSQLCSCCGYKNTDIKNLSIRTWTCPKCNTIHDRDHNAAININNEGLRILTIQ